jgi:hypothetical protein
MTSAIAIDVDITTLDELLPELDQPRADRFIEVADADITICGPATLPDSIHRLLRENPKFRLSWERRRPDLRDQTLSGYEMSLASIARNAGWSPQQICNLLRAFREKQGGRWHGRSYYRSTIGKAMGQAAKHGRDQLQGAFRAETGSEDARDREQIECKGTESAPEAEANDTSSLVAKLNRALILNGRIRFNNVIRRGSCYVAFDDSGHEVPLGSARELNAFLVPQAAIAEATGVNLVIPGGKKGVYWYPVVELIILIAHSQPIVFDYGLEEETRVHLARALNSLTSRTPGYAVPVDLSSGQQLYEVNWSIRNGRRDTFLYHASSVWDAHKLSDYNRRGRDYRRHSTESKTGDEQNGGDSPWPRFVFWSTDRRLCVQVPMLQMFLGTPVGGNERVTTDRLKQGLAAMKFNLDAVKTGQFGRQKISDRWSISPPAFELEPECHPQPGLSPHPDLEEESSAQANFQVGDLVLWETGGVLRFLSPQPISRFSADGQYVFFECTSACIPVSELIHA